MYELEPWILEAALEGFSIQISRIEKYIHIARDSAEKFKNPSAGRYHSAAQPLVRLQKEGLGAPTEKQPRKLRKMSAKGKANIAAAQRLRWHREKLRKEVARVKKIRIV